MRIMVTGGAGFIGSHLVERLLAEGETVDVVDDLSTGSLANLAVARGLGGELKIHHLDACTDEFASLVAIRRPDVLFHLGLLPPNRRDPATLGRAVRATVTALEAARLHGVGKVVVSLDGDSLYGEVALRDLPVKEGRPWAPAGPRGVVAKAVVEMLQLYRDQHSLEFTALAMAEVYGPRQRPDGGLLAALVEAHRKREQPSVRGDARQTRDLLWVDDAVDALVRAGRRGGGLVVNVGTGVMTSVRDLWTEIAGPGGGEVAYQPAAPDDVPRFALSPTRARIHLAWAPWTELATGVRSLLGEPPATD